MASSSGVEGLSELVHTAMTYYSSQRVDGVARNEVAGARGLLKKVSALSRGLHIRDLHSNVVRPAYAALSVTSLRSLSLSLSLSLSSLSLAL